MAEIVRMPKLSDTMTEGTVAAWHKKVGDKVKSGEVLAEIETDKATMEFESFQDGVLLHIGVEKGATAAVDSVLAILGKEGEDVAKLLAGDTATPAPAAQPQAPAAAAPIAAPVVVATTTAEHTNGRLKASPLAKKIAKEKQTTSGRGQGAGLVLENKIAQKRFVNKKFLYISKQRN